MTGNGTSPVDGKQEAMDTRIDTMEDPSTQDETQPDAENETPTSVGPEFQEYDEPTPIEEGHQPDVAPPSVAKTPSPPHSPAPPSDDEGGLFEKPLPLVLSKREEVLHEESISWDCPKFTSYASGDSLYSPDMLVNGVPFRFYVFPRGNNQKGKNTSVFLEVNPEADGSTITEPTWQVFAHFELWVTAVDGRTIHKVSHFRFRNGATNWGFHKLAPITYTADALEAAHAQGEADKINVGARITLVAGSDYKFWGTSGGYNCKAATGMVGLLNQGATCYMNSLLQTLYHTRALRQAVFNMPTGNDDQTTGVALAVQRVFFQLQTSDSAVETDRLTKSFGWESIDSFIQHDVQEFLRKLMDNLEEKMTGTPVDGVMAKLFKGSYKSFTRCVDVDYESSRSEDFYDIQLNVKGLETLEDSFRDYIKLERIDGENQYQTDDFGLQDADRGMIFEELPPVLHLHLKRFVWDLYGNAAEKINDRFEFGEHLNLDDFLDQKPDTPADYTLHSVLVHSGVGHGGHYVGFVRPSKDGSWYQFDDETVYEVDQEDAIEGNYGSNAGSVSCTNAYMLVYVRDSDYNDVMPASSQDSIPPELVQRFAAELVQEEEEAAEAARLRSLMRVHLLYERDFVEHTGFDLVNLKQNNAVFQYPKTMTVLELLTGIAASAGVAVASVRIWAFESRQNRTTRPESCLDVADGEKTIFQAAQDASTESKNWDLILSPLFRVFVEILPAEDPGYPLQRGPEDILLFFKFYDSEIPATKYVGHMLANKFITPSDLKSSARVMLDAQQDAELLAFEEVTSRNVQLMLMSKTLVDLELQNGDIVVWQMPVKPDSHVAFPTVSDYYAHIINSVDIEFRPYDKQHEPGTTVTLDRRMTFKEVHDRLGEALGMDNGDHLKLTQYYLFGKEICQHVRTGDHTTLQSMRFITGYRRHTNAFLYEVTALTRDQLEQLIELEVQWLAPSRPYGERVLINVPGEATVDEILAELQLKVHIPPEEAGPLRLLLRDYSNVEDCSEHPYVAQELERRQLAAEVIPEAQRPPLPENALLVEVFHFYRTTYNWHGDAMFVVAYDGESVATLRKRLHASFPVGNTEWNTWKLFKVCGGSATVLDEEDTIDIADYQTRGYRLGLDHIHKAAANPRLNRELKIHN